MQAGSPWPAGLETRLLEQGVWLASQAEELTTRGTVVTEAEVTAWRTWYDIVKRAKDNYNATIEAIDNGTITTWTEAEASLTA